jgi:putative aldouronate transport system permease protein
LPFLHVFAISLSSKTAVSSGKVFLWPVDFTTNAYTFITRSSAFVRALFVPIQRVSLGVTVHLILIVATAYPLSLTKQQFRARNIISWFFILTILFNGGLIPSYMMVRYTRLLDTLWALVLPGALPVFSMLVVMNFMRSLPGELSEAAYMDGASHFQTLLRIILPVSSPTLATVTLFSFVAHWNSWFDGLIYMNSTDKYPLQSYLQTIIINPEVFFRTSYTIMDELRAYIEVVSARTSSAAQLFLATIPILMVYPFLQRYFTTGLVIGSVKG